MEFEKAPKHTGKTMSLILLMSLTVAAGVYRNGFPAMFPFIHAEFGLSRTVMGLYISFLYLVSAALAIFAGWFADRLGAKKGILIGMGSLTILIFAHIFAPSFSIILVLAALCGIGFSIVSPGSTKAVTDLFSPSRRGTAMGLLFMGWSIGGLAGSVLGRPAWGLINDRLLKGREDIGFLLINLMNALVFALFVLFYRFTEVPAVWIVLAATFIAGFSTRGWPGVFFAAVSRDADRGNTGMSAGLTLVFVRLGITLSPPVFGFVADITGSYEYSWILMVLFTLISGVGFYMKKDTAN